MRERDVAAWCAVQDAKLEVAGRLLAALKMGHGKARILRATYDGLEWIAAPRAAGDEAELVEDLAAGLHPNEMELLRNAGLEIFIPRSCVRCTSKDAVLRTDIRVGARIRFEASLCPGCTDTLVVLVRPFLKEVPEDKRGPRSIIL